MKSRDDRLFAAYCARLASGWSHEDAWADLLETVAYFDAHCPRSESDRKVSEELSDPVRAAAVAFVRAQQDLNGNEDRSNDFRQALDALVAAVKCPDAVAAERGAKPKPERIDWGRPDLELAQLQASPASLVDGLKKTDAESFADFSRKSIDAICSEPTPAPNWRALVVELREACAEQGAPKFSDAELWHDHRDRRSARAVYALIAALDSKGDESLNATMLWGYPLRSWTAMQEAGRKAWNLDDPAKIAERIDFWRDDMVASMKTTAALEATRKELAELLSERAALYDKLEAARSESERKGANLDAERDRCHQLRMTVDRVKGILGGEPLEIPSDAARRVVAERNEATAALQSLHAEFESLSKERDELRAKLAAQDELRDAAVEYVEADIAYALFQASDFKRFAADKADPSRARFGRAGLRYLAARDAAAKDGGV